MVELNSFWKLQRHNSWPLTLNVSNSTISSTSKRKILRKWRRKLNKSLMIKSKIFIDKSIKKKPGNWIKQTSDITS